MSLAGLEQLPEAADLIGAMLSAEPSARPNIDDVCTQAIYMHI